MIVVCRMIAHVFLFVYAVASQPTTTCTTPSMPMTGGDLSALVNNYELEPFTFTRSSLLSLLALCTLTLLVEFSDVLEYIPRPCRPFHQKHQVGFRDNQARDQTTTGTDTEAGSDAGSTVHLLAGCHDQKVSEFFLHLIQPLPVASLMEMSLCSICVCLSHPSGVFRLIQLLIGHSGSSWMLHLSSENTIDRSRITPRMEEICE